MRIQIYLEENETQENAENTLIKAITSKYDSSKVPHPDPVVEEISIIMKEEYDKMIVAMMSDIFQVIKYHKEVK